jgi:hypothetical protein
MLCLLSLENDLGAVASGSGGSPPDIDTDTGLKGWNIVSESEVMIEETEEDGITIIRKRNTVSTTPATASVSPQPPVGATNTKSSTTKSRDAAGARKKDDDFVPSVSPPKSVASSIRRDDGGGEQQEQIHHQQTPRGFHAPLADGSTIHPKLPFWFCRTCLCLLGVVLSLFSDKYILVTFFSWELAVLGINGLPNDVTHSSVFVVLLALMGLKEPNLKRLKTVLKLGNCVITDFSLFVVFVLLTRVVI